MCFFGLLRGCRRSIKRITNRRERRRELRLPAGLTMTRRCISGLLSALAVSCVLVIICLQTITDDRKWVPTPASFLDIAVRDQLSDQVEPLKPYGAMSEKWIVVTTLAPPTEDVKFLASLPGWRVVVVGDVLTPGNWSHPNCDFLNISMQERLGYLSPLFIPTRNYGRKNIGYLHAILHGAKFIYETDDDNRPLNRLEGFDYGDSFSGLHFAGKGLFNPYHHFGQSTLWPRGYPLSAVGQEMGRIYSLPKQNQVPSIQQGIVNGDPDMDAIFRLSRKKIRHALDVHFDPAAPAALVPAGVYSPFNSQNTLFRREAFWALLIPTTTTMRVCDIWRGYWAQRLLWEIGGRLAFYPANAYQQRNAHDYTKDATEELALYTDTEKLLAFLREWVCPPHLFFFGCVEKLTSDLVVAGFWGSRDVKLTRAWLVDLQRVGYTEPSRVKDVQTDFRRERIVRLKGDQTPYECKSRVRLQHLFPRNNSTYFVFYPVEQDPPPFQRQISPPISKALRHSSMASEVCPEDKHSFFGPPGNASMTSNGTDFFDDILVIVTFHYAGYYNNIRYIEAIYRAVFPNIVYCGPDRENFQEVTSGSPGLRGVSFIEVDTTCGYLVYACVSEAMRAGYTVSGYLHMSDDILINPWSFSGLDKNKLWMNKNYPINTARPSKWMWWNLPLGRSSYQSLALEMQASTEHPPPGVRPWSDHVRTLESAAGGENWIFHGLVDIYYVPIRLKQEVMWYFTKFYDKTVFLEIAVPNVLRGLDDDVNIKRLTGKSAWAKDRKKMWSFFDKKSHFMHPVKLSDAGKVRDTCERFIPVMFSELYS